MIIYPIRRCLECGEGEVNRRSWGDGLSICNNCGCVEGKECEAFVDQSGNARTEDEYIESLKAALATPSSAAPSWAAR